MEKRTDEFKLARNRMAEDIGTVVTDGEDVLKAAAHASAAGLAAARDRLEEQVSSIRTSVVDASRPALDKVRSTAAAANGYVHEHPWTLIGVAAVAGMIVAYLAARR
jgi:ElaB/YqjD/DUF883 family membrane-anchored ribosome-binding protein